VPDVDLRVGDYKLDNSHALPQQTIDRGVSRTRVDIFLARERR
jgi:hypothetical protein